MAPTPSADAPCAASSDNDTICAVASPPGRSAYALIRLSGPLAAQTLQRIAPTTPLDPWRRAITRIRIALAHDVELPALLISFVAPASYTGEHVAEIITPGAPALLDRILALLCAHKNIRIANPGEFTARAFLNEKMTIEQAEGVALSVAAENNAQLLAAKELLSGRTGAKHRALADQLAGALALVEAGVDFTDQEDVVPITPADLFAQLGAICADIQTILSVDQGAIAPSHTPRVVLVGAPNAGKSTLFNALLRRTRAAVSDEPGATRDAIVEDLDLSIDMPAPFTRRIVQLIDLPGLDEPFAASSSARAQAQRAARNAIKHADVLIICDPVGDCAPPAFAPKDAAVLRVRTKADLVRAEASTTALPICALDGWNLPALRRSIADAATTARASSLAVLAPRHAQALTVARDALTEAVSMIDTGPSARALPAPELLACPMRAALNALGEISGAIHPDDIIGRVFATFCVGK